MFKIEFEIKGLPKMTNSLHVHWTKKHKESKLWKGLVQNAVLFGQERAALEFLPLTKAKLTLTRCSAVEPDYDGLVSSFKHVIDGLKEAGVIKDDKASNIGQSKYAWEFAKQREGKIRVMVEEVAA